MNINGWKKFIESIGEIPISDIDVYNRRMEIGWKDKLFWIDKIYPDVVVDFGCADGSMISKIKLNRPNIKLIGYEPDHKMLSLARYHFKNTDVFLSDNWDEITKELFKYRRPALLLSSVIHEVYSYSDSLSIRDFWKNKVFNNNFKWICIRDMMPSSAEMRGNFDFLSDVKNVRENIDPYLLNSYESIWGKIDNSYSTFIHFLLKYKYIENWNREVAENYFPLSIEGLHSMIPNGYQIIYQKSFILPHFNSQLRNDFNITAKANTHTKIIIINDKYDKKLIKESSDPISRMENGFVILRRIVGNEYGGVVDEVSKFSDSHKSEWILDSDIVKLNNIGLIKNENLRNMAIRFSLKGTTTDMIIHKKHDNWRLMSIFNKGDVFPSIWVLCDDIFGIENFLIDFITKDAT